MRGDDPEEGAALRVRFPNELDVAEPEIAQAAVDELGGGARRGAAEVCPVEEGDAKPRSRGLVRDARPDYAAADDEEVERRTGELGSRALALGG